MGIHDGNVTAADIAAVVADGTGEGLQLEFKRQVNPGSGREWAADVTAMANTAGGAILIGVAER